MNRLTRRALLETAFGAAAVALVGGGCSRRTVPPGELRGASAERGHVLRGEFRHLTPANWLETEVVILGGGVAGLSAAWKLGRLGIRNFLILELEGALGGTSRSGEIQSHLAPLGAHYVPLPLAGNGELTEFLRDVGAVEGIDAEGYPIGAEEHLCRDPHERIHIDGRWWEGLVPLAGASPQDAAQISAFESEIQQWARRRDASGKPAFALPLARCSPDSEFTALDRITFADWLQQRGFSSSRVRWMCEYGCRDEFGASAEHVSAWAGLFYWCARLHPATGQPQPVLTWPEGNGRLVKALSAGLDEKVHTDCMVVDIEPRGAGEMVEVVAIRPTGAVGVRALRVICACPAHLWSRIVAPWRERPPAWLAQLEYGSWVVANVALDSRPTRRRGDAPLAWDNVSFHSPSLGYVVATHQSLEDHGATIFTHYHALADESPSSARARLLELGRDEWAVACLTDLAAVHPDIWERAQRVDVARWGHAMVRPRPGLLWGAFRHQAAAPLGSIHFAHTDLSGMALFEEAFYHGTRAATEVVAALRGG